MRSMRAGRGTRHPVPFSAATIGLSVSGITMVTGGLEYTAGTFVTPAEIGKLDGAAGYVLSLTATPAIQLKHGIADTANHGTISGSSLLINTGLTSIVFAQARLFGTPNTTSMATTVSQIRTYWSGSQVTVSLYGHANMAPSSAENGISVAWAAFGT